LTFVVLLDEVVLVDKQPGLLRVARDTTVHNGLQAGVLQPEVSYTTLKCVYLQYAPLAVQAVRQFGNLISCGSVVYKHPMLDARC
jgi:hypothetical protein